MLSDNIIIELY